MNVATGETLSIADHGKIETLAYAGLLDFHQGDSWFGLSVGFRAMQLAGHMLSEESLWDRRDLYVVSGHPGPGVRDAVEYVTRCVSHGRFRLAKPKEAQTNSQCRHAGVNRHPVDNSFDWIPAFAGTTRSEGCSNQGFPESPIQCSRDMKFEWQVSDGHRIVDVRLRPDFVPEVFFELLDRRDTGKEKQDDRRRFGDLKHELSARVWETSFAESFEVQLRRARVGSHA